MAGITGHWTCQGFGRNCEYCQFEFNSRRGMTCTVFNDFLRFSYPDDPSACIKVRIHFYILWGSISDFSPLVMSGTPMTSLGNSFPNIPPTIISFGTNTNICLFVLLLFQNLFVLYNYLHSFPIGWTIVFLLMNTIWYLCYSKVVRKYNSE